MFAGKIYKKGICFMSFHGSELTLFSGNHYLG
ncbi:MAG: hypothetical protein ACJAT7_001744 [Psychromonas sp.]|jgi:hypothetical protein